MEIYSDPAWSKDLVCELCDAYYNADYRDVKVSQPFFRLDYFYVTCPVCKTEEKLTEVPRWVQKVAYNSIGGR